MIVISKSHPLNSVFKAAGYLLFRTKYARLNDFDIRRFHETRVKAALRAATHVPYYQDLFRTLRFDVERDFTRLSDLERLPLLTKDTIRSQFERLVNPRYRGVAVSYATSGSTGAPMKMLLTPYMVALDKAMIFRHFAWSGRPARPVIFSLRSYVRERDGGPLYRHSRLENNWYFSAYDLNRDTADYYVQKLLEINPHILRGYPSSIRFLCDYLTPALVARLTRLQGIYVASETLTEEERDTIEALFGKRLFNWYGMTEPAIIIKEGADHHGMHLCMEYGYPEFLEHDQPHIKRLVTTSIHNPVMPFIRYDTGDLVEIAPGEPLKVKAVLGRKDEYIVGTNGARLPSINFYTLFRDFTKISAFQLVQYSTLEVLALLRCAAPLSTQEKARLHEGLVLRIGKSLPIYIEERERFFTNSDGKALVISRQPGSYKISSFESYSLSTQRAWANQRQGIASFKLDWNEADEVPDPELLTTMRGLFSDPNYAIWYPEARHAQLLKKLITHTGVESEENILLTHGSDNGLRLILQAFTDKSTCMVIMPTYDNFRAQAEAFGNKIIGHQMKDGSESSLESLLKEMERQQPRLLYVVNPNNPIGYQIDNSGLERLLSSARHFRGFVVVDEAYCEFSQHTAVPLLRDYDNLFAVRTFSKAFGLAGMRLGYVLARSELIAALNKVNNVKDVTMFSVEAAEYMLDHYDKVRAYVAAVNANKETFYDYCRDAGIRHFPSAANFVSYEVDSAERYLAFMADQQIFLRNRCAYFDGEFVRATIGGGKAFVKFLEADRAYRTRMAAGPSTNV